MVVGTGGTTGLGRLWEMCMYCTVLYSAEGDRGEGGRHHREPERLARRTVFPSQPAGSERLRLSFVVSAHLHSARRCLYDQ